MHLIIPLSIIVILNPYAGLDYEKINVYSFEENKEVIEHISDYEIEQEYEQYTNFLLELDKEEK